MEKNMYANMQFAHAIAIVIIASNYVGFVQKMESELI